MKAFIIVMSLAIASVSAVDLSGKWEEVPEQRDNLDDFLYQSGLNYFSRKAATGFSWQNHQEITQTDNTFHIKGEKGPTNIEYDYVLTADGTTKTVVPGPVNDGNMDTTTVVEGNKLITKVKTMGTEDVIYTSTRSKEADGTMKHSVTHLASGSTLTSVYKLME